MDTIFALASAKGRSGVAVIRVSGPQALEGLKQLSGLKKLSPRRAVLRDLIDPVSRETIDRALVLPFEAPHSYTGEDTAEYHVHGGLAVINTMLETLGGLSDYRLAAPGEFTRRAFENGKMDLTEAEAIADLINAETQMQKEQALAQMGGALEALYTGWADQLTKVLAHVEADLEFPDEDLPDGILPQIMPDIKSLGEDIKAHLQDNHRGERLRDGIKIAIIGAPNAGKSSLVNALTRRDVAIVSDLAGTTRDVIETHLDIAGYPVILSDTAGLRPEQLGDNAQDKIESEGIRRALNHARTADLKILLYDGTMEKPDAHTLALEDESALPVANKMDQTLNLKHPGQPIQISAKTGTGIEKLIQAVAEKIEAIIGKNKAPALTRQRHREALEHCAHALARALEAPLPELVAEDLRLAIRDLGRITGRVDVEDLLDVLFRDFCIGK